VGLMARMRLAWELQNKGVTLTQEVAK
jgi:hypothetical protein